MKKNKKTDEFPPQHQDRMPGLEKEMRPRPLYKGEWYKGSGKLKGRKAIVTGGDSGIGRAVSLFFAREGADVAVLYCNEHDDAAETREAVEKEGARCLLMDGDAGDPAFCGKAVSRAAKELGGLNILVNNASYQAFQPDLESLPDEQLLKTFSTNVFAYFYMARACLRHFREGDVIINTSSVTAYKGSTHLLDYASTKAAEVGFTRALARVLAPKGIRVNAVAPGPVWTPLTPSTYPPELVRTFGRQTPMGRAAHPEEIAPSYVFLASRDSSYFTGTVLHPDGGTSTNT
ncbi:MAG: SDR family oxidoreductase [Elusimicrobiales bacterium]|nr:SDR family oxidoreductase [Elusimicrobiales bacterium]